MAPKLKPHPAHQPINPITTPYIHKPYRAPQPTYHEPENKAPVYEEPKPTYFTPTPKPTHTYSISYAAKPAHKTYGFRVLDEQKSKIVDDAIEQLEEAEAPVEEVAPIGKSIL